MAGSRSSSRCTIAPTTAHHAFAQCASAQKPTYLDQSLPFDARVNDLVGRMTLAEKVSQMKDVAPAIERLGVPAYNWWNEGLPSHAPDWRRCFRKPSASPQRGTTASSSAWPPSSPTSSARSITSTSGTTATSAYQGLTIWSPNINLFRDPRWGRGQETYGEDPYLTGRLAVPFIRGLQGDDSKYFKTIATVKHFAVHSGPESERHTFDAEGRSERDLRESYLPHFEMGIREGGAYSLMCAYNRIYGQAACAQDLLGEEHPARRGRSFRLHRLRLRRHRRHLSSPQDRTHCGCRGGTRGEGRHRSRLRPRDIRISWTPCSRVSSPKRRSTHRSGDCFSRASSSGCSIRSESVKWAQIPISVLDQPAHKQLAQQVTRESIVLLKNAGNALPLRKTLRHHRRHRPQRRPEAHAASAITTASRPTR